MANALSSLYVEFSASTKKFSDSMAGITRQVKEVDKILRPLKDRAAEIGIAMTAGITIPLVGLGTAGVAAALKIDDAMDDIRSATGLTGNAFAQLGDDFRATLGRVPNQVNDVAKAIGELSQRTNLSGKPLQTLTEQMLNLSRLTKEEVGASIETATRTFGDWNIAVEEQSESLDFLYRVTQQTGIGFTDLNRKIVQFGAPLRQMGFDFETAATLLGKFEKEGVNAELVMGSLRIALTKFAKEGITDAKAALLELSERIKGAGSASQANVIAVQAFGAKAGPDMAAAIREGRFAIEELMNRLKESPETINKAAQATFGFTERLEIFRNKATLALEPVGVKLLDVFERFIPVAERAMNRLADMANAFSKLPPSIQDATVAIGLFAIAVGPALSILVKFSSTIVGLIATLGKLGFSFTALSAAMTAVPLLAAVKSYADLSAAIGLIGGTSVAATAGLGAIAAAIGVGIGMIANYIIEITGLQKPVDSLIKTTVNYIPVIGTWATGQNNVTQAVAGTDAAVTKLVAEYAKYGIAVDATRVKDAAYLASLSQQRLAQIQAARSSETVTEAITRIGNTAKTTTNDVAALNKMLGGTAKAAEQQAKAVDIIGLRYSQLSYQQAEQLITTGRFLREYLDNVHRGRTLIEEATRKSILDMGEHSERVTKYSELLIDRQSDIFVDSLDKKIKAVEDATKRAQENYRRTFDSVKSITANTLTQIITEGEFSFRKFANTIKGIFASLATEILSTVVATLVTPFVQKISGLITGGIGSLLSRVGVSIPGLAGGGVLATAGGAGAGVAGGVGAGAGAGGGMGAAIAGFATNPITIAVAGALATALALKTFVGRGRRTANEFVSGFQDPFVNDKGTGALNNIVDAFNQAKNAGTLTFEQAVEARDAASKLWEEFKANAEEFRARGKTEATVVDQAFNTFRTLFGDDLEKVFTPMNETIDSLRQTSDAATEAANAESRSRIPETGLVRSASQVFADAVARFDAAVSTLSQSVGNANVEVNMPITVAPVFHNATPVTVGEVRDTIMPEITSALETNIRGFAEVWARVMQQRLVASGATTI